MQTRSRPAERNVALEQLRAYIDANDFGPGDRLPAERVLINSLGISRATLRKGLDALEREGTIWRRVGKGTFLAERDESPLFPGLADLSRQVTPVQMIRARLLLEPSIAREAAANASADAVSRLRQARDEAVQASSWDDYEAHDDDFHRCVADATGNVLLCSLFEHLNEVRRAVAWRQVVRQTDRPPATHPSFAEHDHILEAIESRDPPAAQTAMREHLNSVFKRLFGDV